MNIFKRIKHIRDEERKNKRKREALRQYILSGYEHFSWEEVLQVFVEAYGSEEDAMNVLRNIVLQRSLMASDSKRGVFGSVKRGLGIGNSFEDGVVCARFVARLTKVMDAEARRRLDYSTLSAWELRDLDKTTFLL